MTREQAELAAWIVGGAGLAFSALAWLIRPSAFAFAWLAAVTAWAGFPLGCMALLLTHGLTGGRWGDAIRPYALAGIRSVALLLPAVLPLLFVAHVLYPWLRPDTAADLPNRFYLNAPFATARLMLYLGVWFVLAALTLRAVQRPASIATLAPPALILLGLTVTFAAIDATESLDPHFNSSAYGMIAAAEAGLFALAICVLAAAIGPTLPSPVMDDLSRLLFALLILWAYLDFVQILIVWNSDLPREAAWYAMRISGGWGILAGLVAFGHFALPFFALLTMRSYKSRRGIIALAGLLIAMEVPRAWWLVLPAAGRVVGWVEIAAMLAVAGIATAITLRAPSLRAAMAPPHHA